MLKIAVTGAAMSGKTSLLARIKASLEKEYGIKTYVLSEIASDIIEHAFVPNDENLLLFQSMLYELQKTKEDILLKYLPEDGILITDRGLADGASYTDAFGKILEDHGDDMTSILSRYDHIIQLQTTCVFQEVKEIDTSSNNNRVIETSPSQACEFEEKLKRIYETHPSYHFISAENDIEEKYETFLNLILDLCNSAK